MQKLIDEECLNQLVVSENVTFEILQNESFMAMNRLNAIKKLHTDYSVCHNNIDMKHKEHLKKILVELKLIDLYDRLLQRTPSYITIYLKKLNEYMIEVSNYLMITEEAKEHLKFNMKVTDVEGFELFIEKLPLFILDTLLTFMSRH